MISLDEKTRNRVWELATPIRDGAGPEDEIIGVFILYRILKLSLGRWAILIVFS